MYNTDVKENVLAGIVGAFLFSLVGGVLWYVLYQVGFMAGISGFVGVVCALKGYEFFAKKESRKGVIISVLVSIFVMIIAWYLCLATDVYKAYQEWYANGDIDYTITFVEAVRGAYIFLSEPEIAPSYFGDLAIGLLLCVVGCWKDVINAFRSASIQSQPMYNQQMSQQMENYQTQQEDDVIL